MKSDLTPFVSFRRHIWARSEMENMAYNAEKYFLPFSVFTQLYSGATTETYTLTTGPPGFLSAVKGWMYYYQ